MLLCSFSWINAQESRMTIDTTVYDFVEEMPVAMLSRCIKNAPANWTIDSIRLCGQYGLLSLVSGNIRYPEEARQKEIQGTVVVRFVVEPNGKIGRATVLRDIGGGCGDEALRVLRALDEAGLSWQPGMKDKKAVRVSQTLPIRFKLEEAKPYYLSVKGDTIYHTFDSEARFRGGIDSLAHFIQQRLNYPKNMRDSCKTGIVEMALFIRKDGKVEVDNQLNFNHLGLDFEWESLQLAKKTNEFWTPAQYQGQAVNSMLPLRAVFKSDAARCKTSNANFDKAVVLGAEAIGLMDAGKLPEAIDKLNQALLLDPFNTEYLYYRGTAFMQQNERDKACADYNSVKKMLGTTWFEGIRKLLCGY